jgi:hypothetical protein
LATLSAQGGDSSRIADRTIAALHAIDGALSPIISERGVAALYRRCLFLTRHGRPWLDAAYAADHPLGDYSGLRVALSGRSNSEALNGANALLNTFHGLLVSLIGSPLTERLLRSILEIPSSGDAVQDVSP